MIRQFVEIAKRIVGNQKRFSFRAVDFFIDKNNSSRRLKRFIVILRMIHKNNITRLHYMDFIHSQHGKIVGTDIATANQFSDFPELICSWKFHSDSSDYFTRSMYWPVAVSILILSPSLMNNGTFTDAPVSTFAGLVAFVAVF